MFDKEGLIGVGYIPSSIAGVVGKGGAVGAGLVVGQAVRAGAVRSRVAAVDEGGVCSRREPPSERQAHKDFKILDGKKEHEANMEVLTGAAEPLNLKIKVLRGLTEALHVAAVAHGDVDGAAGVDGVVVDRVGALILVEVTCSELEQGLAQG